LRTLGCYLALQVQGDAGAQGGIGGDVVNLIARSGPISKVVLLVLVLGGLPNWGYHNYGWAPSGIGGILLIVVLILLLTGRL